MVDSVRKKYQKAAGNTVCISALSRAQQISFVRKLA